MLVLLLVALLLQVKEQTPNGVFYVLDGTQIFQLERRSGLIKAKSNIFTSSAKGYYQVEGIVLNRGLPSGEYAFDSTDSQGLFCFGFDKK